MSHLPQVHRGGASQLLAVLYVLTGSACCDSPPLLLCLLRLTNTGVPHDLSAGRCLGTVWYHHGNARMLGSNAGPRDSTPLTPVQVLQGRLRVVALAVGGGTSLTNYRVWVVW